MLNVSNWFYFYKIISNENHIFQTINHNVQGRTFSLTTKYKIVLQYYKCTLKLNVMLTVLEGMLEGQPRKKDIKIV